MTAHMTTTHHITISNGSEIGDHGTYAVYVWSVDETGEGSVSDIIGNPVRLWDGENNDDMPVTWEVEEALADQIAAAKALHPEVARWAGRLDNNSTGFDGWIVARGEG